MVRTADTIVAMAGAHLYRFAARPKWIAGHVLAVVAVVGFVNLGFWQLRRHDERAAVNHTIDERMSSGAADLLELVAAVGESPELLEFRRVSATGSYVTEQEVLWQARTRDGRSGHDVLTPLQVGGRAVMVDRGWVPIDATGPPVAEAAPARGEVEIVGVIRPGQERSGLGPIDPDTGDLERVSRVDIPKLQRQVDLELYPFYILLEADDPPPRSGLPLVQPIPVSESGPHLGYAVQWFVFAAIAAVGYPVLLRRTARDALVNDPQVGGPEAGKVV